MNAQEQWKRTYRLMQDAIAPGTKKMYRGTARTLYRREAALERKLEAAERKIEALQDRVWQLDAQEHSRDDGNEWEKEYYLRGMHR